MKLKTRQLRVDKPINIPELKAQGIHSTLEDACPQSPNPPEAGIQGCFVLLLEELVETAGLQKRLKDCQPEISTNQARKDSKRRICCFAGRGIGA